MVDILHTKNEFLIGALAAATATNVARKAPFTSGFMCTRLEYDIAVQGLSNDDQLMFVLAYDLPSVTDIKASIELDQLGRLDNLDAQASMRHVIKSLGMVTGSQTASAYTSKNTTLKGEIKLGGGRGLPFPEGDGISVYAYNLDEAAAVTTGSGGWVFMRMYGSWLGD